MVSGNRKLISLPRRGSLTFWLMAALLFLLSGCATTGQFPTLNLTNVELSEANYRIVAANVHGEASAGYLLGFSGALGSEMRTLALFRVSGKGMLYKEALEKFWQNFEKTHGPIEGRKLALVNVRYDSDAKNILGLYTEPTISIRADVIEFIDQANAR